MVNGGDFEGYIAHVASCDQPQRDQPRRHNRFDFLYTSMQG